MSKKKALGGGVSALFGADQMNKFNSSISDKGELIVELPVNLIKANPDQPRRVFDKESIDGLAASIEKAGLLQPISVKKEGEEYFLIAGERRLRAVRSLGEKTIKSIIVNADPLLSAELALIENIQREDLNPIDEAAAYSSLIEKYGMTHEGISEIVGKSRAHISNLVRLLNLTKKEQEALKSEMITVGHAKILLSIKEPKHRKETLDAIVQKGLTVRQTEQMASRLSKPLVSEKREVEKLDADTMAITRQLADRLGTKVSIKTKQNGFGSIILDFYSNEDRDRIVDLLFHVEQ